MPRQGMIDYAFGFDAPGASRRDIDGDFFHIVSAPTDVEIEFNRSGRKLGRAQGMGGSADYSSVTIHSPVAQQVIVALGFGTSFDSRASLNANITASTQPGNTLPTGGDVNCPSLASTILIAADADRLAAEIYNLDTNTITFRVGGFGVGVASGRPLPPGDSVVIASTAIISAFNPGGVAESLAVLPLRQV